MIGVPKSPKRAPTPRRYLQHSTTPVKKVNRKRKVSEFARAYGSAARVAWVRGLPCVLSAWGTCGRHMQCDNAHIIGGGAGRKADAQFIVPLCSLHHASLHRRGRQLFEAVYLVDLFKLAADTERRWQDFCEATT